MGAVRNAVVRKMEDRLRVELPYLREMASIAPGGLVRLGMYMAAAAPRTTVPRRSFHMASLGATMALDCGECVQIEVNLAQDDGVSADDLRAALDGRLDDLRSEDRDAFRFGQEVTAGGDAEPLRARLLEAFGEEGALELAFAAAFAQFFPVLKRGMGFARSCSLVQIQMEGA